MTEHVMWIGYRAGPRDVNILTLYLTRAPPSMSGHAGFDGLAESPYPPEAFPRGDYHRLRIGLYRAVYVLEDDLITIERVDRVTGA